MARPTIAPTLEGAPFKLRLGGAFLSGSARSGKFRGVLVPVPSTETRVPHHDVLPSDSAGNSTTANARGDPRVRGSWDCDECSAASLVNLRSLQTLKS